MTIKLTNPNPYGLLSQQRLNNFERSIKIRLPTDYRNFLLQYNGGNPVPSFFWIESKKDGSCAFEFYGLHDGPEHLSINTYKGKEHYGIPDSLIPIGDDGTGSFTYGYFGGIMDEATGLLYVGNPLPAEERLQGAGGQYAS